MTLTTEDVTTLKRKFAPGEHEFHPYTGYAYIREGAICDRIEEVDPAWTLECVSLERRTSDGSKDKTMVVVTMRMTIKGVSRDGIGMADVNLTKTGDDEANEAEKSAATDALKRCARLFGIGRYLLDLPPGVKDERSLSRWLSGDAPQKQARAPRAQDGAPSASSNGSNEAIVHFVDVKMNKSNHPYIVAEGGYTAWTREPFRVAGVPCDEWGTPGHYMLDAPVVIQYETKDGFRKVTAVRLQEGGAK